MSSIPAVQPWVPTAGSRVPPVLPRAYPGGVTPWGPLAGWWRRVAAFLLDGLVQVPGLALVVASEAEGASDGVRRLLLVLGLALAWGATWWNRVVVTGRTGRSWGKRVTGLRLVSERTGEPLGGPTCLGRGLVHLVDQVLLVGFLRAAADPKGRTFADSAVGSVVVRG